MPSSPFPTFLWASGIEDTFIPQVRPGLRSLDEYELAQHYQQWQSDFDLLADTGVQAARWGIPWYRVQPRPDVWDWAWTDRALDYLVNVKGITPILDLVHYGAPLWLENTFLNFSYPQRVAEYAAAVSQRYGSLVRWYTPLNEPDIHAQWCGMRGEWPPYLKGLDGFLKMILALARGMVLTTRALKSVQPDCGTVQAEAVWRLTTRDAALQPQVDLQNEIQYLGFDLATGRVTGDHPLAPFLLENGVPEADLAWFQDNAVDFDVFGANFYPWSYRQVYQSRGGKLARLPSRARGEALGRVLRDVAARYPMPVMVTETSAKGSPAVRRRWMDETIAAVRGLRQEGLPIVGYTWFPLLSMVDWKYRIGRRPFERYLIHLGLYDTQIEAGGFQRRCPTGLEALYRQYIQQPMPEIAHR